MTQARSGAISCSPCVVASPPLVFLCFFLRWSSFFSRLYRGGFHAASWVIPEIASTTSCSFLLLVLIIRSCFQSTASYGIFGHSPHRKTMPSLYTHPPETLACAMHQQTFSFLQNNFHKHCAAKETTDTITIFKKRPLLTKNDNYVEGVAFKYIILNFIVQ